MRYQSFSTVNPDAYRAGFEMGSAFKSSPPELVVLFLSINYASDYGDFYAGMLDGLGGAVPLVCGCTGDGIYETARVAHHGAVGMGFDSSAEVKWKAVLATGVGSDSFAVAQKTAREALEGLGEVPSFAMVLADGVTSDGSRLVEGFQSVLPIPFIGGLAGDSRKFEQSYVVMNDQIQDDAALVLVASGAMKTWMNAASGWTLIGAAGVVESCKRNVVERISGKTPYAFMHEQLGKSLGQSDIGLVPLAVTPADDADALPALRSVSYFNPNTGTATLIGSIREKETVRVCTATQGEVLAGVLEALDPVSLSGFDPKAILVISCAGRKWVLGNRGEDEVQKVLARIGKDIPLIGFPSFGEIAPFFKKEGSYTSTRFHNVTFCICLLG